MLTLFIITFNDKLNQLSEHYKRKQHCDIELTENVKRTQIHSVLTNKQDT